MKRKVKLKEMCEAFDRQQDEIARLKGLHALSLMANRRSGDGARRPLITG